MSLHTFHRSRRCVRPLLASLLIALPVLVPLTTSQAAEGELRWGLHVTLAEAWTESKDRLTCTFTLRKNARFQNGDPVTAEDGKFSFERSKGASAELRQVRYAPVYELAFIWGVGSRVEEPGAALIPGFAYSAPFEDLKLKK
jgi:ABC-type transport system substrate-binding protein